MSLRRFLPRMSDSDSTSGAPVQSRCCTGITNSRAAWRSDTAQCAARTAAIGTLVRGIPAVISTLSRRRMTL